MYSGGKFVGKVCLIVYYMQGRITLEIVTPRSIIVRGKILNDGGLK